MAAPLRLWSRGVLRGCVVGALTKNQRLARDLSESLIGAGPYEIIHAALSLAPVATYVGFSGGFDSLVCTHWCMNHVAGCRVFHANTGIGIEATREYVRKTCAEYQWPLIEIRAKEDCGQDYDQLVLEQGFPGPAHHYKMFQRLKERPVRKLVRDSKTKRGDLVAIFTGIRQDESKRRSGYHYTVLDVVGSALWVNPFYYRSRAWFTDYITEHKLKRNPVSEILGMSGECLCGAFAHKGEKALIKTLCPATFARIEALEYLTAAVSLDWGWEEGPKAKSVSREKFMPFCVGCEK